MNQNSIQKPAPDTLSGLLKPLSQRGIPPWVTYFTAFLGLIYILNPGAGFIEIIPDMIPFIGNLDEGAAFLLLWYGLVEYFEGRKYQHAYSDSPGHDTDNIIDL